MNEYNEGVWSVSVLISNAKALNVLLLATGSQWSEIMKYVIWDSLTDWRPRPVFIKLLKVPF